MVLNCMLAPVAIVIWVIWVIWVICFLLTQMTQKAQIWRPGNSPALGHLGHLVIVLKSARVELSTWRYTVFIYSTIYNFTIYKQ
jgi:hypothetical protein